jgi:hypothetical protein
MATHKYRIYDTENGQYLTPEFAGVLDVAALTGVATTSGSAEITVASTTGVFPFMSLHVPGLPHGSFVRAVKSSTVIVAARVLDRPNAWVTGTAYIAGQCVWWPDLQQTYRCAVAHTAAAAFQTDFFAGKWVLVSEPLIVPAYAEATASGLTGHALPVSPQIPELIFDGSTYRNEWTIAGVTTLKWDMKGIGGALVGSPSDVTVKHADMIVHPDSVPTIYGSPETAKWSHIRYAVPDEQAGIPPRPEPKWQSFWYFIHAGGAYTKFPARTGTAPVRTGAGT